MQVLVNIPMVKTESCSIRILVKSLRVKTESCSVSVLVKIPRVKNQSCLVRVLLKILRVKTQSCSVRVLLKILSFKIQTYSVEGPKYNSDNYNPISLTCICYKLLEHNLLSNVLLHIRIHITSFVLVRCIIRHTDTYYIIFPCQMYH